jgi:hypothetical protein
MTIAIAPQRRMFDPSLSREELYPFETPCSKCGFSSGASRLGKRRYSLEYTIHCNGDKTDI